MEERERKMVALGRAEYNGTFGKKRGLTREEVVTESKVWQLKMAVFPWISAK